MKFFIQLMNLINNKKKLLNLQKRSHENFYLTNKYACKKIDDYRSDLLIGNININNKILKSKTEDYSYNQF